MAPKIKHKRSALVNNPPTAAQIEAGEIAINTNSASANLHFEDDGATVRSVGADPTAIGTYERNVATADGVGTWVVAGSQAPGNDAPYGHWDRDNASTTLSPRIAGDDITTTGDVQGSNFVIDQATADVTLAAEDPAAARTYTFPDVGGDRGVVLDPDTPATTTQYAREITGAGVATWEEIDIPPGTTIGTTPPLNPTEGQLWFNSDDGRLYIYYTDADSSQWVDASPDNDGEVLWERTGTTLSPANAGDDVEIGSGNIALNADGSATFAAPSSGSTFSAASSATTWEFGPRAGSGPFYITNSSNNGVQLNNNATAWSASSDERLKTNLQPIENGLAKVSTLRAVTGRYKTDEETTSRSFLIAQDVLSVLPEAVETSDPDSLGLRYTEVIPLLIAALKESKDRIEALEAEVQALKGGTN